MVGQGSLEPSIYMTRLGHFLQIMTRGFLRIDSIYYGYFGYDDED